MEKVFKIELMVLDLENIGQKEIVDMITFARYPNNAIAPIVMKVESRDIEWTDKHPINKMATYDKEFERLFHPHNDVAKRRCLENNYE